MEVLSILLGIVFWPTALILWGFYIRQRRPAKRLSIMGTLLLVAAPLLAVVSLGKYMFLDEPLVFAVQEGNIHEIRSLLERGASPNAEVKGTPALEQAAATGNERVVQILLHYGARTDVKNESNGHTALQSAQEYGYTTVAEILRTAGETK